MEGSRSPVRLYHAESTLSSSAHVRRGAVNGVSAPPACTPPTPSHHRFPHVQPQHVAHTLTRSRARGKSRPHARSTEAAASDIAATPRLALPRHDLIRHRRRVATPGISSSVLVPVVKPAGIASHRPLYYGSSCYCAGPDHFDWSVLKSWRVVTGTVMRA